MRWCPHSLSSVVSQAPPPSSDALVAKTFPEGRRCWFSQCWGRRQDSSTSSSFASVLKLLCTPQVRQLPIQMIESASQGAAKLNTVHVLRDNGLQLAGGHPDFFLPKQVQRCSQHSSAELCIGSYPSSAAIDFSAQGRPLECSFCGLLWVPADIPDLKHLSQLQLLI